MAPDTDELEQAVGALEDPELGLSLHRLGMVRSVRLRRHRAAVVLALPIAQWPDARQLAERVGRTAEAVPGVDQATVDVEVMTEPERMALRSLLRAVNAGSDPDATVSVPGAASEGGDPGHSNGEHGNGGHEPGRANGDHGPGDANGGHDPGHAGGGHGHGGHDHGGPDETPRFMRPDSPTRIIGISSGKGGVGKSSVTVNLAVALAQAGQRVGVLDADVYGFSVPKMLGTEHDPVILGDLVVPTAVHGVRCLSMGFFVPDDQPVIWRGPMLHKAIEQFLGDAFWGEPDFLLVDMPPGTGDVTLSVSQVLSRTEVVVVTTPQPAAQRVAQRSAFAARKLKLSVRGVIENMSWFTGDDGQRYELFGRGGGERLAQDLGVPLLGQLPLVPALREGGDRGVPVAVGDPEGEAARAFATLAGKLVAMGPARVYRRELSLR